VAGALFFICWRSLAENPFIRLLRHRSNGPRSLFSFAAPDRVRGILANAGFHSIAFNPLVAPIGGADIDQTLTIEKWAIGCCAP
jgi:hypothetical protein